MRDQIVRLCVMLEALRTSRRGLTIPALVATVGASRSSVYRYLGILRSAGLVIEKETVNGEARHRLLGESVAALGLGTSQIVALALARDALAALDGTDALEAIDRILESRSVTKQRILVRQNDLPKVSRRIVKRLDDATKNGHRLRLLYRSARDPEPTWREVDPGALQLQRNSLYLWAYALEHREWRTYKVVRIVEAERTGEDAVAHPGLADVLALDHAVQVWSGPLEDVAIRIAPEVAWLAREHPLVPSQRLEPQADGAVIVRARVAGLVEVTRWILRWGAHAEALEPGELRARVADELRRALASYGVSQDRGTPPRYQEPSRVSTRSTGA